MKPDELSPRQGKVLRYLTDKTKQGAVVTPQMTVVKIAWSDLPHTVIQARTVLRRLVKSGLAENNGDDFRATEAGLALIKEADAAKLWRKPPPPEVTNVFRHRR